MTTPETKHSKDEEFLISVAESIGSTLGTIASKAAAGPKALLDSDIAHSLETQGKRILRQGKSVARKGEKIAARGARSLKASKAGKAVRRGFKRVAAKSKKAMRSAKTKVKARRRTASKKPGRRNAR
jgi:hypothetical protein